MQTVGKTRILRGERTPEDRTVIGHLITDRHWTPCNTPECACEITRRLSMLVLGMDVYELDSETEIGPQLDRITDAIERVIDARIARAVTRIFRLVGVSHAGQ